jgi:hypothetical protein
MGLSNAKRHARASEAIVRHVARRASAALALMALMGAGAPVGAAPPAAVSKPWVYKASSNDYRLTLPSGDWHESNGKPRGSHAFFVHETPIMQASVMQVRHEQSADDLATAAERARKMLESSPQRRATAKFQSGTNAAGNRYQYFTAVEPGDSGEPVFIGNSFTWNPRTRVLVIVLFEGLQKAKSDPDKAAERAAFQKASDLICLSVE